MDMLPSEIGLLILALCVLISVPYIVSSKDDKSRNKKTHRRYFDLSIASIFFAGLAVINVALGFCGDVQWIDFMCLRLPSANFCAIELVISYALAISAITLWLWNGIESFFQKKKD